MPAGPPVRARLQPEVTFIATQGRTSASHFLRILGNGMGVADPRNTVVVMTSRSIKCDQ